MMFEPHVGIGRVAHPVIAGAALGAGFVWICDYIVLPVVWAALGEPAGAGPLFQRLDGLSFALEFGLLVVVAIALNREIRPADVYSWVTLACACLAGVFGVGFGLRSMAAAEPVGASQAAAVLFAGLWLILANGLAVVRASYPRWLAWFGIGLGILWLVALGEVNIIGTGYVWVPAVLAFPVWAIVFGMVQLLPQRPAVSAASGQAGSLRRDVNGNWWSADGRWWWDGSQWRPVDDTSAVREARPGPAPTS